MTKQEYDTAQERLREIFTDADNLIATAVRLSKALKNIYLHIRETLYILYIYIIYMYIYQPLLKRFMTVLVLMDVMGVLILKITVLTRDWPKLLRY